MNALGVVIFASFCIIGEPIIGAVVGIAFLVVATPTTKEK